LRGIGQRCEVCSDLRVCFAVKSSHQIDEITAGIALGKAVPDIFRQTDDKGVGVISAMQGARAEELIAAFFKGRLDPLIL